MNLSGVSTELRPVVEDLNRRFEGRFNALVTPRLNEVYFHVTMDLVPGRR